MIERFKDALSFGGIRTRPEGYSAPDFPEAPFIEARGLPPFDGTYWSSFVETGLCLRLDLEHPAVPAELAATLRARFSEKIGDDGALYEYERQSRSQHRNRQALLERLAQLLRER